eukprot:4997712-Amphidinium_carterae.1
MESLTQGGACNDTAQSAACTGSGCTEHAQRESVHIQSDSHAHVLGVQDREPLPPFGDICTATQAWEVIARIARTI